jgi:isocitrate dehydrogenase kinase/phosphatase
MHAGAVIEADRGTTTARPAVTLTRADALVDHARQITANAREIVAQFRVYNEEFGRITRRAADHFLRRDWNATQADAVSRIELYEQHVAQSVLTMATRLGDRAADREHWKLINQAYGELIQRLPDSDFYRTFFNSVTRDTFGTVGVNAEVEFCATTAARASGTVPIRVYPVGRSLLAAVRDIVADLPFAAAVTDIDAVARQVAADIGRNFDTRRQSAAPQSIEMIEPLFYRGNTASIVGRLVGDGAMTPLVVSFVHADDGVAVESVMLARNELSSFFGFSRSYFHVDLPVVSAAVTLLRSFLPQKPVDELYTVLGRAKQGKTERYFTLRRHLDASFDTFVQAPGQPGLVMIVFTLPSHDLVFKVIRDRFGAPKNSSRAEVMDRYRMVFRHDRAGRLVDAQEFKRLRLPRARFMPALAEELLTQAAGSCRIDGDDLIIEHCYIERRLRPLDLFLREADPAAAEAVVIDYGRALRELAAIDIFPGDLLLKNFGVTRHGRVIFYDYDELCPVTSCDFRDLPSAGSDEEETSAEPWFYVGPNDVFPEQWLPFLSIPDEIQPVFMQHHGELLTADWWRRMKQNHEPAATR